MPDKSASMIDRMRLTDPALVHVAGSVGGPRTHVLLVGIGHYVHLPDGGGEVLHANASMRQLASPPRSVRALADWFVTSFDNPERPLGTVSLVISEASRMPYANPATGASHDVPEGTTADVKAAIRAWAERLSSSEDGMAVFAFCGHGFSQGLAEALLLRDFGSDRFGPLDGAMDLTAFKSAMSRAPADTQVLFIDACRSGMVDLGDPGNTGTSMLAFGAKARLGRGAPAQSVHYSTLGGLEAYGLRGRPSFYTDGLLKALASAGRQDEHGDWWVSTPDLQHSVEELTGMIADGARRVQRPEMERTSSIKLTRLPGPPMIPVHVRCDPEAMISEASLACRLGAETVGVHHGPSMPHLTEWTLSLSMDKYEFSGTIPSRSELHAVTQTRWLMPPIVRVCLPVTSRSGP